MRVKFRVNLGSIDAAKLKLDHRKCQLGSECHVEDDAGQWLVKHGIAEELPVRGVARAPAITGVKDADLKDTKSSDK